MNFKMIIALVDAEHTTEVLTAARAAGATGATVLNQARGEGVEVPKTFMGLELNVQRDMLLFVVEEQLARSILESIAEAGKFERSSKGIAFQLDVEDAIGLDSQVARLMPLLGEKQ